MIVWGGLDMSGYSNTGGNYTGCYTTAHADTYATLSSPAYITPHQTTTATATQYSRRIAQPYSYIHAYSDSDDNGYDSVTVKTNPTGLSFTVDGTTYTATKSFPGTWLKPHHCDDIATERGHRRSICLEQVERPRRDLTHCCADCQRHLHGDVQHAIFSRQWAMEPVAE